MAHTHRQITIPAPSIVMMIGPSGAGKSTLAARSFAPDLVLSTDAFRSLISGDINDQAASGDAHVLLYAALEMRAKRGLASVVDATCLRARTRREIFRIAGARGLPVVGLVLDLPPEECRRHLQMRRAAGSALDVPETVPARHSEILRSQELEREPFAALHRFTSAAEVAGTDLVLRPTGHLPSPEIEAAQGCYDIVGDVHGCMDELEQLLELAGYRIDSYTPGASTPILARHPDGRRLIFVGDLVDRGPRSEDVLRLVLGTTEAGLGDAVVGNHDDKLARLLAGRNVTINHGLGQTIEQLERLEPDFVARIGAFLRTRPFQLKLPATGQLAAAGDGHLTIVHAAAPETLIDAAGRRARDAALYGLPTGDKDEFGYVVRADWAADYHGRRPVIHGHTPLARPTWLNRVICIDTGCVFGGALTMLRADSLEILSVTARRIHAEGRIADVATRRILRAA